MPTKMPIKAPVEPWQLRTPSASAFSLIINFSWPAIGRLLDLDTGIYFLGKGDGPDCEPTDPTSIYILYGGDKDGTIGGETYIVRPGFAFIDGLWTGPTTIELRAGWDGPTNYGQAIVKMTVLERIDGTDYVRDTISFVINPSLRAPGQCAPVVAIATVSIGAGGEVFITIPK
jgi:hypothetical protein